MGFQLLENFKQLNLLDIAVLGFIGLILLYCFLSQKVHYLLFALILSASFNGSTIPVVDNIASLTRWIILFLLFGMGFLQKKIKISFGLLLWWAYVFVGFIFLLRANQLAWQIQRSSLLLIVSLAIPFTFSTIPYQKFRQCFGAISIAASIYSIVNFLPLANSLANPTRYQGYAKGAATFAVVLGGLLPFMLWGLLNNHSKILRTTCFLGFLLGFATLIFTGQRTGTIAGIISIIPIVIRMLNRRTVGWFFFLAVILSILSTIVVKQTSWERLSFLLFRYSASSGLSYREQIWEAAFSEIDKNPLLGRGVGAAETVISSSFHNAYLEVWFNTGFLGLAFFIIAQIYFLLRIILLSNVFRSSEVKSTLALSLGYLLSFMLMSLVESTGATASSVNLILFLYIGVYITSHGLIPLTDQPQPKERIDLPPKILRGAFEKNLG